MSGPKPRLRADGRCDHLGSTGARHDGSACRASVWPLHALRRSPRSCTTSRWCSSILPRSSPAPNISCCFRGSGVASGSTSWNACCGSTARCSSTGCTSSPRGTSGCTGNRCGATPRADRTAGSLGAGTSPSGSRPTRCSAAMSSPSSGVGVRCGPETSRTASPTAGTPGWNDEGRNVATLLDLLWHRGEVMIVGRDGQQRLWDLAERSVPVREPRRPAVEVARETVERQLRARGVGTPAQFGRLFDGRPDGWERALERLVRDGIAVPVTIDGIAKGDWYAHAEVIERTWRARTVVLSPFDDLVSDRDHTEALFDFHFRLEIYVPKAERRWGYFVLPILRGPPHRTCRPTVRSGDTGAACGRCMPSRARASATGRRRLVRSASSRSAGSRRAQGRGPGAAGLAPVVRRVSRRT